MGGSLNPVKAVKKAIKKTKSLLSSGAAEVRRAGVKLDNVGGDKMDVGNLLSTEDPFGEVRRAGVSVDKFLGISNQLGKIMPDMPEAPAPAPAPPVMDIEELKRARRRKSGAGASTILSSGNPDGLGG